MSTRRGACPALSAPMPTGDGLLIRLSPMFGGLSPSQLIGLCEAASRHGNGIVEVTARGSLQFRGLGAVSAVTFANDVNALDIDIRTGVPVEVSPLAGIDPTEITDPNPLAARIRKGTAAAGLQDRLGPKVSVVIDAGGQISLTSVAADIRLQALRLNDGVVWSLALAGDAGTATAMGDFVEDEAVAMASAVLADIAAAGRDARARDVIAKLRSYTSTPPSVLPDISPSSRETTRCAVRQLISPLEGEMSGRTEGGVHEHSPDGSHTRPQDFILPLTNNRLTVRIALPFGHADVSQLIQLIRQTNVLDVRPAPDRSLLLICASVDTANRAQDTAATLGFITFPADPRAQIAACPGAPACASGRIAARAIAAQLAETLEGDTDLSIHISGCEKGCARQAPSDIAIVGGENGAGLVVNGTPKSTPLAYRSEKGLPEAIAAVAKVLEMRKVALARTPRAADKPGTLGLSDRDKVRLAAAFEQAGR